MNRLLLFGLTLITGLGLNAQLLNWSPPFPTESNAGQTLVITVDATKGNQGLLNYTPTSDVYVHTGVITNLSTTPNDWRYVKFNQNFNLPNPQLQATYLGNNKWQFTITGSLKTYYGVPAGETILKIAILFRNGNGTRKQANIDESDMYIPVYGNVLDVRIFQPPLQPKFIPVPEPQNWPVGTNFNFGVIVNKTSNVTLYHNGSILATGTNVADTFVTAGTVTAIGNQQLVVEANDGTTTKRDTINIFVSPPGSPVAPLPSGVKDGINYEPGDTSVTLVLRAPGKNKVTLIGDFNNWIQNINHILNKTPDGKFFWIRLRPLTPGTEYAYQYIVDDSIKIADPYTEKVLDPFNDPFISSATYPNLKPYPAGQTGIVSVLQTAKPSYTWAIDNFSRPDKRNLIIYKMLVRDFVAAHDWKTVSDSLNYLKTLGVSAIEVMPFNEFEGNISWGYNPNFYFAPDKYYGPENTLKRFIDSCHKKGIAVVMDIALNHSFGSSPMVQLYWDAVNSRPASNNPWFNPVAKHAFNVGYDMNHGTADTKYFFGRVVEHWLQKFKIDGFRFDLSKGYTQTQTCDNNGNNCNVGAWSAYDASRVAIWKGYYDTVQNKSAGAYAILEHFADNTEEKELADYGMLFWGNLNYNYMEAAEGTVANSDFNPGIYTTRGWTKPHLVTYMESHDEERIMYNSINNGNSSAGYNIRDTATALKRMELNAAFLFTIPGPKLFWQFGELGYDYPINYCPNGTINNACRTDPKPIRWDYLNDNRRKNVYTTYSKLLNLRLHPWYKEVFMTGTIDRSLNGAVKWIKVSSAADTSDLLVVGNFDVNAQFATVTFQTAGTWYDLLNNTTFSATGTSQTITLQPGEFHVYVNRNVNNLTATPVINVPWNGSTLEAKAYPNPISLSGFNVEVNLPQSGNVTIELYNHLGQYVSNLYNNFLIRGTHQLALKKKTASNGIYYLKIQSKNATKTIQVTFQ